MESCQQRDSFRSAYCMIHPWHEDRPGDGPTTLTPIEVIWMWHPGFIKMATEKFVRRNQKCDINERRIAHVFASTGLPECKDMKTTWLENSVVPWCQNHLMNKLYPLVVNKRTQRKLESRIPVLHIWGSVSSTRSHRSQQESARCQRRA